MNRFTWKIKLLSLTLFILTAFTAFAGDDPISRDDDPRIPVGAQVLGAIFDKPYTVRGITYHRMKFVKAFHQEGIASWYGKEDHGKKTSSGERYNMFDKTAAHKQLPMGSLVRVDCKETGKSVVVRINDRGPHVPGRVIDLSYTAASELELIGKGLTKVELTLINPQEEIPEEGLYTVQLASYSVRGNAEEIAASIPNSFIESADVNGVEYFRIKVKGFTTREDAERFQQNNSEAFPGALVISE
ncbi:MAG: septal ring lytic transglycosylase RlpA family protein [Deferribacterales bacterium]